MRYLYEQAEKGQFEGVANGQALLNRLLDTDETGADNIVQAVYGNEVQTSSGFLSIMGRFGLALALSDTGLTSDDRFNFDGINLRATQNDNRGTVLEGPALRSSSYFPYSDTLAGSSMSFIYLTAEDVAALNGQLSLSVSSDSSVGAYLIKAEN
jgi:hypothetical protein